MLTSNEEILLTIGLGTLLLTFFAILIVIAIVKYQNKSRLHLEELNQIRQNFQKENLKAKLEIREQTLDTVSKEIHDNIGQVLSLAKLTLYGINIQGDQFKKLENSRLLVSRAIKDLKRVSRSINPKLDSSFHLLDKLKEETILISESGQIKVDLAVKGKKLQISPQYALILYRIFQEVVNNAIKHAKATTISITLNYETDQGRMIVKDDGKGFQLSDVEDSRGSGLKNLKYRANVIGGQINIDSAIGRGTKVTLYFLNNSDYG